MFNVLKKHTNSHFNIPVLQVVVDSPTPPSVVARGAGGAEDTLLLLNFLKEKIIEENRKKKVLSLFQYFSFIHIRQTDQNQT